MKFIQKFLPILLFSAVAFTSCDDNSSSNNNSNNNVTPASGTWKVTYFFDKQDETSYFSGYTFEFGANGSLSSSNGSQSYSGTWSTGFDDSANKFLIDFSGVVPSALSELEEDWRIIKVEDNFMHFEHTSGGNGDTDIVKFSK